MPDRDGTGFLSALYEGGYLQDPVIYICPSEAGEIDRLEGPFLRSRNVSYLGRRNRRYRLTSEGIAKFGSRTALSADRSNENHETAREVLFGDGRVDEVDVADLDPYLEVLGD